MASTLNRWVNTWDQKYPGFQSSCRFCLCLWVRRRRRWRWSRWGLFWWGGGSFRNRSKYFQTLHFHWCDCGIFYRRRISVLWIGAGHPLFFFIQVLRLTDPKWSMYWVGYNEIVLDPDDIVVSWVLLLHAQGADPYGHRYVRLLLLPFIIFLHNYYQN